METIEIEVPVSFVEGGIEKMKSDVEALEEALEILEENNLTDNDGYPALDAKKHDVEAGIEQMEEKLDNHAVGLGELFG